MLLVSDQRDNRIVGLDGLDAEEPIVQLEPQFPVGSLTDPCGLLIDGRGWLLIADRTNGRIVTFDHARDEWSRFGEGVLAQPTGLAADQGNRILIADGRRLARARNAAGSGLAELLPPAPRFAPVGVAVMATEEEQIVVADVAGGAVRISDDSDGTTWTTIPLPPAARPGHPWGVAPSADGGVLITDLANARVLLLTPDGTITTVLDADDGVLVPATAVSAEPGILVADAGAGWVRGFVPAAGGYEPAGLVQGRRADGTYRFDRIGGLAAGDLA